MSVMLSKCESSGSRPNTSVTFASLTLKSWAFRKYLIGSLRLLVTGLAYFVASATLLMRF